MSTLKQTTPKLLSRPPFDRLVFNDDTFDLIKTPHPGWATIALLDKLGDRAHEKARQIRREIAEGERRVKGAEA